MLRIFYLQLLLNNGKIGYSFLLFSFLLAIYACNGIDEETILTEDVITLKILNNSGNDIEESIGNGSDLIKLQAEIFREADKEFREVTFRASDGNFEGVSENSATVLADNIGFAETMLRLPLDSGELFLSAEVKGKDGITYVSEKTINLTSIDAVIDLDFKSIDGQNLSDVPKADGSTTILIEGTVLVDVENLNSLTFTSTKGRFQQTGNGLISQNRGEDSSLSAVYVVPQEVGPTFFTVKTGESSEYSKDSVLVFERAFADEIFLEPTTLNMNATSSNLISAFLTRNSGKVSKETEVDFEAFQTVGGLEVKVGRFTGLSVANTDLDGKATATFYADTGDIDFLIPVTIRVSTQTDSGGNSITDEIDINVTE